MSAQTHRPAPPSATASPPPGGVRRLRTHHRRPAEMEAIGAMVCRPTALALAPILIWQGKRVRRQTPILPEASGERSGLESVGEHAEPTRLLVIGESTAAGVGVADQRDGLPRRLAAELAHRRGRPVAWHLCARTGATASDAARELVPHAPAGQDLALVVLGVNDTLRLRSRRAWRTRLDRVLDSLAPHLAPGGRVILAGVPDLGSFPALPQPLRTVLGWHARGLDRELRRLAAQRPGVLHVPVPPLTAPDLFATDAFHPNADAYAQWAQHLAETVN